MLDCLLLCVKKECMCYVYKNKPCVWRVFVDDSKKKRRRRKHETLTN